LNVGISFDGLRARGVAMDAAGKIVARAEPRELTGSAGVIEEIFRTTNSDDLESLGLAYADPDPGTWDWPTIEKQNGREIPVQCISSGNASVLAEMWYGAGRGARDVIAFSVGRSVSAGIVSNGQLLMGAHKVASSVAWLSLNPVEREDYKKIGCLEAEAAAPGIVKRLVWRVRSGDPSKVVDDAGGSLTNVTLEGVLTGAREGDGVAISVIRDTVRYLAMAVSNIAAVVDPEVIVLGGILQSANDLLLEPIRQECARRMPKAIQDRVRIEASPLGADAPAMGAARFAAGGTQLPDA